MTPLYPFQADAVAKIAADQQVYLGFDPGLGKSRTAIHAAKKRAARRILVICPAIGRVVWEQQCALWAPGVPVTTVTGIADLPKLRNPGFVLVTYGLLSQRDSPYVAAINKGPGYDMTVLDEAAAVKNPGANRTKAILGKMLPRLGYVLPMSGTPAPNHAGELFPILKALYPDALLDGSGKHMNQWLFEDTFCKVVTKKFGGGPQIRTIEGSKNMAALRARLHGFMLRVRKEDVLTELPPIRFDIVPLGVKTDGIPDIPAGLSDDELLKWLSGATGNQSAMRIRHLLGAAKVEPAVEYIDEFLAGLSPDKKVLVFAHHADVIAGLVRGLSGHTPMAITGATGPTDRSTLVHAFLNQPIRRLLIANIQAAGTGLTLVGPNCKCSDVIFVEPTYSPADNVQAACRVHRIGQKEAVVARFLTAHGTIDDRIQSILARKAQDFSALFN